MEKFRPYQEEMPHEPPKEDNLATPEAPEQAYRALKNKKEENPITDFTPEQQAEIRHKQQILSSLAYFIGKDFCIPVELNKPGAGWHWDFKENVIRIDPKDLLEKPMDYLRFVISHEGGHRRITRTDFIPLEEWNQPGFSFMMNAIEDPRVNNFVAESYPKFQEQMYLAYKQDLDLEEKAKEEATQRLGQLPRFMQAGFEYIKQWFRETQGQETKISADLPKDVRAVVQATLESARDSWLRYPSRKEADKSEEPIKKYARVSYEISRDEVWPEFKKLVEADMADQKIQEFLKDIQTEQGGREGTQGLPQELKDKLTPEEQKALEEAIKKAIEDAKEGKERQSGKPVDLASLPEGIKQKIKEYIDSLPEDQQREIAEKAQTAIKEFEDALNEELQGKLADNPERKAEREKNTEAGEKKDAPTAKPEKEVPSIDQEELKKYKDRIAEELKKDANIYETMRREVLPLIDKLETELREIFVARQAKVWKSGFTTGKRIDIKKRIQEKAKSVPAVESKAWQKRELPKEKDYAISLLVDLSGSMGDDNKIEETFKAVIVLSEVLNRLSINFEILGFNTRIYEYKDFDQPMSKPIRENMGGMLKEVDNDEWSCNTDSGWALEEASERLSHQKADQKFLIVLSDGMPQESPIHPRSEYELGKVIQKVLAETDIKLIGLGVGEGTEDVGEYYPNSIANVEVKEMAEKLADLIEEVIANYDNFSIV